jgi:hypothetical protein
MRLGYFSRSDAPKCVPNYEDRHDHQNRIMLVLHVTILPLANKKTAGWQSHTGSLFFNSPIRSGQISGEFGT